MLPLFLVAAVACQPTEQQIVTTGPDVEAIDAWLDEVAVAVNAGDVDGILAHYADDAVFSPPDAPSVTLEELRAWYDEMFGASTFEFSAEPLEVVVSGDLAVLRASYEETITPMGEGEPETHDGNWLVVLRKQADGSWKLWRDMWSVIQPPPPPAM
jgi:uncharacterized protein (TIGR02246 family)